MFAAKMKVQLLWFSFESVKNNNICEKYFTFT